VLTRGGRSMPRTSWRRSRSARDPGGNLGEGAALAMAMVPFLLATILFSYSAAAARLAAGRGDK